MKRPSASSSPLRFILRWSARLFPLLMLLGLTGCSFTDRQSTLDPKGPLAQMQLDLFMVTLWVTLGIFIVVGGALAYTVWRYREKPTDDPDFHPDQGHGNPLIEMGLIVVSTLLLVIIAVPTVKGIWMMHTLPDGIDEEDVLEITVRGYQWWWAFEYEGEGLEFTTANEMVIPVGKVVKLNLRAEDVIHSFWLPKIAGKTDLMPGQANWMWLQAAEEGHYYGQCAEYCGDSHAYMLFRCDVVSDEEFDAWVADYKTGVKAPAAESWRPMAEQLAADQGMTLPEDDWAAFMRFANNEAMVEYMADDPVTDGARLFFGKGQCVMCHAIDGSPAAGVLGPNLTRVGQRKSLAAGMMENRLGDDAPIDSERQLDNLYNWIAHSETIKPGNLMYAPRADQKVVGLNQISEGVTDDEFRRIAQYLQTLN